MPHTDKPTPGFKVLRPHRGALLSFVAPSEYEVVYVPHRWTTARVGPLFAFDSLPHVMEFLMPSPCTHPAQAEIWRCLLFDAAPPPPEVLIAPYVTDDQIEGLWRQYDMTNPHRLLLPTGSAMSPPRGTILAGAIKLTKRVC